MSCRTRKSRPRKKGGGGLNGRRGDAREAPGARSQTPPFFPFLGPALALAALLLLLPTASPALSDDILGESSGLLNVSEDRGLPSATPVLGVTNLPPRVIEVVSTNAVVGRDAVLLAVIFDPNGAEDICSKGGCNVSCSYAELFTSAAAPKEKETFSCRNLQCSVSGQFKVLDSVPVWDPKTSRLSARISFDKLARPGKWDCEISVSDGAGKSAVRAHPITVREPTFLSRLIDRLDELLFLYLLPATIIVAILLSAKRYASRKMDEVDWDALAEQFVETKAHFSAVEERIRTTTRLRAAQHSQGLLSLAKATFSDGDYREAQWIARQAMQELGGDPSRVHVPTRLLTLPEKAVLVLHALRREIISGLRGKARRL